MSKKTLNFLIFFHNVKKSWIYDQNTLLVCTILDIFNLI